MISLSSAPHAATSRRLPAKPQDTWQVQDETAALDTVLLASPACLELVPCNTVSRTAEARGHRTSRQAARQQHEGLRSLLTDRGVSVRVVPAAPELPDLAFTRDSTLMTPWGAVGLRPSVPHRMAEVDHVLRFLAEAGVPTFARIQDGQIEGGDVAYIRPGLLAIGVSGERTTPEGAASLSALFEERGWECLTVPFAPEYLHLDTFFCMADPEVALACPALLPAGFLTRLEAEGVQIIPVTLEEVANLGCNILALGNKQVVMAQGSPGAAAALRSHGFSVDVLDLSEFTACGGGVHCLTAPLRRSRGPSGNLPAAAARHNRSALQSNLVER